MKTERLVSENCFAMLQNRTLGIFRNALEFTWTSLHSLKDAVIAASVVWPSAQVEVCAWFNIT